MSHLRSWAIILPLKYSRKIRHGYMYAIRTYNHGRFKVQKNCTFWRINLELALILCFNKKMRELGTSTINFRGKILQKNSSWLYIQTGVYITMGPYNIDNKPRYLSTLQLVIFLELKWRNFLAAMARHLSQKSKKICQGKASCSF